MPAEGASGAINHSGDMIEVVLVRPADSPRVIMIRWPNAPTITTPARYNEVASTAMRLLAEATAAIAPPPKVKKRTPCTVLKTVL